MKIFALLIFLFLAACSAKTIPANSYADKKIIGTWKLFSIQADRMPDAFPDDTVLITFNANHRFDSSSEKYYAQYTRWEMKSNHLLFSEAGKISQDRFEICNLNDSMISISSGDCGLGFSNTFKKYVEEK